MALTTAEIVLLTGHRQERWVYRILDLQDRYLGVLREVTDASFEFSAFTEVRSSGRMTCRAQGIDWLKVRIQPWYYVTNGTTSLSWPVGVFIPASPGVTYSGEGAIRNIDLYDKLQILVDDKVETTYSVPADTNVTDYISAMLTEIGETKTAITPSDATLRNAMVWEADTTKLKVINDLLESINYFSLWVDGYGIFQGTPYIAPAQRGSSWDFKDDSRSIYSPDFFNERDESTIPNKVQLISTSDGETPALEAVATNENPDSRFSYNQRGRWITTTEMDIETDSQVTLNALAQRRLVELSDVSSTYDISHALIPLELNAAVKFVRDTESISVTGVVQKMSFSTDIGAQVKTTIREVAL